LPDPASRLRIERRQRPLELLGFLVGILRLALALADLANDSR
jgi:hypothetical protein